MCVPARSSRQHHDVFLSVRQRLLVQEAEGRRQEGGGLQPVAAPGQSGVCLCVSVCVLRCASLTLFVDLICVETLICCFSTSSTSSSSPPEQDRELRPEEMDGELLLLSVFVSPVSYQSF